MIDLTAFSNCTLLGGFRIVEVNKSAEPMVDAIGREAVAQTTITAMRFNHLISANLTDQEISITLYHEILEAATVASDEPPASVVDFNEGDFERAAHEMHAMVGHVSPDNLNRMLRRFGFGEP